MECDSSTAIEEARMSNFERDALQKLIMKAVDWIDKKIIK